MAAQSYAVPAPIPCPVNGSNQPGAGHDSRGEAYLRSFLPESELQRLIKLLAQYNIVIPSSVFAEENINGLMDIFHTFGVQIPDSILKPKDAEYLKLVKTLRDFVYGNERILIISSPIKSSRDTLAKVLSKMFTCSWIDPPLDKISCLSDKVDLFVFSDETPNNTLGPNFTHRKCIILIQSETPVGLPSNVHIPYNVNEVKYLPDEIDNLSVKVSNVLNTSI